MDNGKAYGRRLRKGGEAGGWDCEAKVRYGSYGIMPPASESNSTTTSTLGQIPVLPGKRRKAPRDKRPSEGDMTRQGISPDRNRQPIPLHISILRPTRVRADKHHKESMTDTRRSRKRDGAHYGSISSFINPIHPLLLRMRDNVSNQRFRPEAQHRGIPAAESRSSDEKVHRAGGTTTSQEPAKYTQSLQGFVEWEGD